MSGLSLYNQPNFLVSYRNNDETLQPVMFIELLPAAPEPAEPNDSLEPGTTNATIWSH
jgi:hypothetical protein